MRVQRYQKHVPTFASDENEQSELWQWNDATKRLSSVQTACRRGTDNLGRSAGAACSRTPPRKQPVGGKRLFSDWSRLHCSPPPRPSRLRNPPRSRRDGNRRHYDAQQRLVRFAQGNYINAAVAAVGCASVATWRVVRRHPQAALINALDYPNPRVQFAAYRPSSSSTQRPPFPARVASRDSSATSRPAQPAASRGRDAPD
jgi:hypothetical protein